MCERAGRLPEKGRIGLGTASAGRGIERNLGKLLDRCINRNQLILLEKIKSNTALTITSLIESIFRESKIPVSTLKLNSRILRELSLIDFSVGYSVRLTPLGEFVLRIVSQETVCLKISGDRG